MLQFFKNLLSSSDETSSKRFAALFTLLNVIILTYMGAWKSGWITPEFMYNSLVLLVGGGLGLTVVEKIFRKDLPVSSTPPVPPTPPVDADTTTDTTTDNG